jgi:hypothetical protein
MKFKTFTSLALGMILSAWVIVASAQTPNSAFVSADNPFANLAHDCSTVSERGSDALTIHSGMVTSQTFVACSSGNLSSVYFELHSIQGEGNLNVSIYGNGIYHGMTRLLTEGDNGLIRFDADVQLIAGMEYQIKILPTNGMTVKLWCNKYVENDDTLVFDGWTLNGTLNYGVGMDGLATATSPVDGGRTPDEQVNPNVSKPDTPMSADDLFLVYPNPFYSDCNINFDHPLRGYTQITLSDAQGNTRYNTGRSSIIEGETINVQPDAALEPGIYILRVLNDGKVYHKTIMKN